MKLSLSITVIAFIVDSALSEEFVVGVETHGIDNSSCSPCTGIVVSRHWVLVGSMTNCFRLNGLYDPIKLDWNNVTFSAGNETRVAIGMNIDSRRRYNDTRYPDLKLFRLNAPFNESKVQPITINYGDVIPDCTVYSVEKSEELVRPYPYMMCARSFDAVNNSEEICSRSTSNPAGSALVCNGSLTAFKSAMRRHMDIYVRIQTFAGWIEDTVEDLLPMVRLSSDYEQKMELGDDAWVGGGSNFISNPITILTVIIGIELNYV